MPKMKMIIPLVVGLLLCGCSVNSDHTAAVYDARIAEKEILTPAPAKTPRINGPRVYGARPGKEFIYRIPCQGQRPILFNVKALPSDLKLDADKGTLKGKVPSRRGVYRMTVTAKNAYGETSRSFALVVDEKIALTPPTSWNS